jgi:hypothetical protein
MARHDRESNDCRLSERINNHEPSRYGISAFVFSMSRVNTNIPPLYSLAAVEGYSVGQLVLYEGYKCDHIK